MNQALSGKRALITGGSRGIGRAIAFGLAREGAQVAIGYIHNDVRAEEVVHAIEAQGSRAVAVKADLARAADVERLFDETERRIGRLDVVVASAADIMVKPLVECTEADYDRIFGLNTKGLFLTLQQAAKRLNDGGRIIVISTGGTRMFFPDQSLYLGSKGAAEQFVRCLAWELAPRGITVNAVSPGPTETDMMQDRYRDRAAAMSPFNRIGEPQDIADVAVFLASDAGRWVTGQNIGAGGGAF
ncbi:MAG TPA: SDR family oxidoreductase [Vicinamibacterales bacterium]|nr:SDR family oxidoreductase [Vicinamibacterales bacterium]